MQFYLLIIILPMKDRDSADVEASSGECIQVVVRCRPFNDKEKRENRKNIVDIKIPHRQISIRNEEDNQQTNDKSFTFDAVYDEATQQKLFYEESCFSLVENVLEGFNATIFAYGQTGCGNNKFTYLIYIYIHISYLIPHEFYLLYRKIVDDARSEYTRATRSHS